MHGSPDLSLNSDRSLLKYAPELRLGPQPKPAPKSVSLRDKVLSRADWERSGHLLWPNPFGGWPTACAQSHGFFLFRKPAFVEQGVREFRRVTKGAKPRSFFFQHDDVDRKWRRHEIDDQTSSGLPCYHRCTIVRAEDPR
jgi:hypothetical protein